MKTIFFTLLTILFFTNYSFAQRDCKIYKNGTFKLVDTEKGKTYLIKRKGAVQEEKLVGEEGKVLFDVTWINDCSYTLHPTKESIEKLKADFTLIVEIIEIKKGALVLRMYDSEHPDNILTNEVQILN
jgi:hypothetical protein